MWKTIQRPLYTTVCECVCLQVMEIKEEMCDCTPQQLCQVSKPLFFLCPLHPQGLLINHWVNGSKLNNIMVI